MTARLPNAGTPARLIRDAADKAGPGVTIEYVSQTKCYVTSPRGKAWACDPECHVLMVTNYHPDDLAFWVKTISDGLIDCLGLACEFCNEQAETERIKGLRLSLDSACL